MGTAELAALLRTWFGALGDRLAELEIDGERAYVLADDLDDLASARSTGALRLLPGFDQYVMGPGTGDGHVVPARRRSAVSKQSGWISPVVVAGGVVRGTWELDGDQVRVAWFKEAGRLPRRALEAEVARLSSILGRGLSPAINIEWWGISLISCKDFLLNFRGFSLCRPYYWGIHHPFPVSSAAYSRVHIEGFPLLGDGVLHILSEFEHAFVRTQAAVGALS